jgi:hypothetical protein
MAYRSGGVLVVLGMEQMIDAESPHHGVRSSFIKWS